MSILAQNGPEARRLPHTSVAHGFFAEILAHASWSLRGIHAGRMTLHDGLPSQSLIDDYLATLARVRATCELLAGAVPVLDENREWHGNAERAFAENIVALKRSASYALVWIGAAQDAVWQLHAESSAALRTGPHDSAVHTAGTNCG